MSSSSAAAPPERRQLSAAWPALAAFAAPALLLLLTMALILAGARVARPDTTMAAGDPGAGRSLVRFYGVEQNATDTYRWSEPLAGVFLYGYEGRPAVVSLRLAAPRPADSPPALAHARSAGVDLGSFTLAGDWRRYHILAPTSPAGETALLLETRAYTPPDDPRELGFALSAAQVAPAGAGGLQPVRALYLLALPLLGWLLLVRLGAPPLAAVGLGVALACAAGWAAASPTAAGYWLPTLGWPWWPVLPLLLLMSWPWLGPALATARSRIVGRPALGWSGLAAALAALVGMRVGLPPWLGMATLVVGVWVGMQNAKCKMQNAEAAESPPVLPRVTAARASLLLPLALPLLLGLALALRLYDLDGQPAGLWRDESRHGLQALRIWSDPSYRPIYVVEGADLPALLFYLMAPVVGLLGPHAWSARLVSALAGALTPLALYWAAGPLVGRRAALIAAALVAWASWSLSMSRWAFPATLDHLLVLTAVGLVWRCLPAGPRTRDQGPGTRDQGPRTRDQGPGTKDQGPRTGNGQPEGEEPPRQPVSDRRWSFVFRLSSAAGMALAGLLGGLAVYAYHTGRVAPLALAAVAAIRLGAEPAAWRRALPGLAAAALVGALTVAPLAAYILGDLDGYNRRVGNVSILDSNDTRTHTPAGLILGNLGRYAMAYHVSGDANGRHHMPEAPMLDPVTGLLMALGLGLALAGARRSPGLAAALALGAVYLIPGVFSGNAPHAMRSLGTLAPACILAGVALAGLPGPAGAAVPAVTKDEGRRTNAERRLYPSSLVIRLSSQTLIALALGASLLFNGWLYFGAMRVEPTVYGEFDLLETTMGQVVQAPNAATDPELRAVRVYVPEKLRGEDTMQFLTWGLTVGGYSGAPLPADRPALVLLPASATPAEQAEALAALGPGATALGPIASYPGTAIPIALAFGRGEAAARLLAAVR